MSLTMRDMGFFAVMTVAGILPQLQCDYAQLVCPLQKITCQCVVTGDFQNIFWRLQSELIASFDHLGQCALVNSNCSAATVEVLASGLSSNISFVAELQPGLVTIGCLDADFTSSSLSYSVGRSF